MVWTVFQIKWRHELESNSKFDTNSFQNLRALLCQEAASCVNERKVVTDPANDFKIWCSAQRACSGTSYTVDVTAAARELDVQFMHIACTDVASCKGIGEVFFGIDSLIDCVLIIEFDIHGGTRGHNRCLCEAAGFARTDEFIFGEESGFTIEFNGLCGELGYCQLYILATVGDNRVVTGSFVVLDSGAGESDQ